MKILLLLLTTAAYAGPFTGFTPPKTDDDREACRGAELVLTIVNDRGYHARRDFCAVKAPAAGKYRTYEVVACVAKKSTIICQGYNVQVQDGAYVGVSNRDDLTAAFNKLNRQQGLFQ